VALGWPPGCRIFLIGLVVEGFVCVIFIVIFFLSNLARGYRYLLNYFTFGWGLGGLFDLGGRVSVSEAIIRYS